MIINNIYKKFQNKNPNQTQCVKSHCLKKRSSAASPFSKPECKFSSVWNPRAQHKNPSSSLNIIIVDHLHLHKRNHQILPQSSFNKTKHIHSILSRVSFKPFSNHFQNTLKTKTEIMPIRIGVIGAGGNTLTKHIPGLLDQPDVSIVAICNRSIESGKLAVEKLNLKNCLVTTQPEDILTHSEIDAVCIGTWPYLHQSLFVGSLQRGKHVLCEARAAMNVREAREMFDCSQKYSHLISQIVPSPLTFTYDNTMKELVNQIGDILHVELVGGTGNFVDKTAPLTWRQDIEKSGENIMMMGIFYEAMMRWVGPAKSVFATGQVVVKSRTDSESGEVKSVQIPDHIDILMTLHRGGQGRMLFSSVMGKAPRNWGCSIYGTEGTIDLDLDQGVVKFGTRAQDMKPIDPIRPQKWRVEEEFINAIRGKEKVKLTDLTTAVQYMEFTSAVSQSLREKRMVELAPFSK